jgi:hypothetical protein
VGKRQRKRERLRRQRHLTEAEYAAMLPFRMAKIVGDLNERLSGVLPDGMRFEWTTEES